jgi:hypothetical protein
MTPTPRRPWKKPEVRRLRAGAAELNPGLSFDGEPNFDS